MLGVNQRGAFPLDFMSTTPGIGDEVSVAGNIPAAERNAARFGMFGNPRAVAFAQPQGGADVGAGMPQVAPISLMAPGQVPMQNNSLPELQPLPGVQPKKPGFFDKGGGWIDALGILGDALAGAAGRPPVYTQMKMQQHQRALAMADEARKQNAAWELWKRQQDYTWANKPRDPRQPHFWESNDGSLMAIGDDGKPVKVYADPTPKMNFIPDGMGGGQWVAVPTSAPGQPSIRPAIGAVVADPRKGGGSGNATGGFR